LIVILDLEMDSMFLIGCFWLTLVSLLVFLQQLGHFDVSASSLVELFSFQKVLSKWKTVEKVTKFFGRETGFS